MNKILSVETNPDKCSKLKPDEYCVVYCSLCSQPHHAGVTGLVTHNKLRSSSLVGCEVVYVLSEGREEAFSQNPKSISSLELDREDWGSGAEMRTRDVLI